MLSTLIEINLSVILRRHVHSRFEETCRAGKGGQDMPRAMFVFAQHPTKRGAWYFGVRCARCSEAIFLLEDHSRGTLPFPYARDVLIATVCPHCRTNSPRYPADQVTAFPPTCTDPTLTRQAGCSSPANAPIPTHTRLPTRTPSPVGGPGSATAIEQLRVLLNEAEAHTVQALVAAAQIIEVPSRTIVYKPGQPSESLYVVVAGRVRLALPVSKSKAHVVRVVEAGTWFGAITVILRKPHVLTASSIERSILARIPAPIFLDCLRRDGVFALGVLRESSRRLFAATEVNRSNSRETT
jgi:hypothetical protein